MAGDSGEPGASEGASLVFRIATVGLSLASAIMTAASTQCVHGGPTVSYSDYNSFRYSALADLLSAVLQGVAIYLQVVKKEKAAKAVEVIDKLLLALTSTSSALLFAVDDITSCDVGEHRRSSRLCAQASRFCGKIRASSFFSLAAAGSLSVSVYTRHVSLGDILMPKAPPPLLEIPTIKRKVPPTTTKHVGKGKNSTKQPRLPTSSGTPPPPPSSGTHQPPPSSSGTNQLPPPPPSSSGTHHPPPPPPSSGTHKPPLPPPPPSSSSGTHRPPPPPPSSLGTHLPPPSSGTHQPPPPPPSSSGTHRPPAPPPSSLGTHKPLLPPPPPPSSGTHQPPTPPPSSSGTHQPPPSSGTHKPPPSSGTHKRPPPPSSSSGTHQPLPSSSGTHQPLPPPPPPPLLGTHPSPLPPPQSFCGCPMRMIPHVCQNPAPSPTTIRRPSCGCTRLTIQHECETHDRATIIEPEDPGVVYAGIPTGQTAQRNETYERPRLGFYRSS